MDRFKKEPLSTFIGLLFILMAFVLLFFETHYDIPLWGLSLLITFGILLCFARDKLIDILTLGLSRILQDVSGKIKKRLGGESK
jgi:hypothetical protein